MASAHCEVCGKALSDPICVDRGIGPECFAKGFTAAMIAEHLAEMTVEELPEGMIPLSEAYRMYKEETDIPPTRLLNACGGNRQLVPPIDPMFRMIRYKGKRYLPLACISQDAQDMLAAMGKRRKRKAKAKAEPISPEGEADADAPELVKSASNVALPGKSFIDQTSGETFDWPSKRTVSRMRKEELVELYERLQGVPPADAFSRKDLVDAIEHIRNR